MLKVLGPRLDTGCWMLDNQDKQRGKFVIENRASCIEDRVSSIEYRL
ncbi:MAG: hypothetical protein PVF56_18135 [Desulfobacterales bacterium]|jgi:hypothetical protein